MVHRAHGEDFCPVADLLVSAAHAALQRLPMEGDVVLAVADLLAALSKVGPARPGPGAEGADAAAAGRPRLVEYLVARPALADIFALVTGPHMCEGAPGAPPPPPTACRLSADGLVAVCHALAAVAIRAGHAQIFTQLCVATHARVTAAAAAGAAAAAAGGGHGVTHLYGKVLVELAVASLRGLARAPRGQEAVVHALFDESLPQLSPRMQHFVNQDDVLKVPSPPHLPHVNRAVSWPWSAVRPLAPWPLHTPPFPLCPVPHRPTSCCCATTPRRSCPPAAPAHRTPCSAPPSPPSSDAPPACACQCR